MFGFPKDPCPYGEYVKHTSPDGKYILVFEPGLEYSMMRYQHQFRLVTSAKNLVQAFRGLASQMQRAWWSPDSRVVAIPVDDRNGGLLLYEIKRNRYSLVRFDPYQETVRVSSAGVRIGVERREFEAVFGKEFPPPPELFLRFAALRWFAVPETGLWKLREAFRSAPRVRWSPSKEMRAYAKTQGIELLNTK